MCPSIYSLSRTTPKRCTRWSANLCQTRGRRCRSCWARTGRRSASCASCTVMWLEWNSAIELKLMRCLKLWAVADSKFYLNILSKCDSHQINFHPSPHRLICSSENRFLFRKNIEKLSLPGNWQWIRVHNGVTFIEIYKNSIIFVLFGKFQVV